MNCVVAAPTVVLTDVTVLASGVTVTVFAGAVKVTVLARGVTVFVTAAGIDVIVFDTVKVDKMVDVLSF